MAKALAFTAAGLLAGMLGCSPFGGSAFVCKSDQDCIKGAGDGRCEADGFCSFMADECAGGRRYGEHSGPRSGQCIGGDGQPDAPMVDIDAPQPEAGDVCYGTTGSLVIPCFSMPPTGTVILSGNIDTNGSMCASVTGTTACVIAGASIQVAAGTTVTATGAKPLVLVATGAIDIAGTLDLASHHAAATPYATTRIGAGADPADPACRAFVTAPGASGGGAGGTFGGNGGPGGNGGGTAAGPLAPTAPRGGCRGQNGNTGTPGDGGHGGGAVWLIANGTITIATGGVINASGEGGHPGVTADAGGGGGGSGGMIGFDAPMIMNMGVVYANGGGGGEGSGNSTEGNAGNEPTGAAAAAATDGGSNGGSGGSGGANGSVGGPAGGGNGGNANTFGGGGGGGGTGVIKVYRGTLNGARSPDPS